MRTARFWTWINSDWVKISLKPEQSLSWGRSERTDEGWSAEGVTWEHDGTGVCQESWTRGKDCDGVSGWSDESFCLLPCLRSVLSVDFSRWDKPAAFCLDEKGQPLFRPLWRDARGAECYDQYAEAAGY